MTSKKEFMKAWKESSEEGRLSAIYIMNHPEEFQGLSSGEVLRKVYQILGFQVPDRDEQ